MQFHANDYLALLVTLLTRRIRHDANTVSTGMLVCLPSWLSVDI